MAECLCSQQPQEEFAPPFSIGTGRVVLRLRVESATFHGPCQQHDFNECKISLRPLENISSLRERILYFLQNTCHCLPKINRFNKNFKLLFYFLSPPPFKLSQYDYVTKYITDI